MRPTKRWDEVQIFFVYDTAYVLNEYDDPQNAIIYFHPDDLSDTVRCTLCCQLMGILQFCKSVFSPPKMINLQTKKFAIKVTGRFALCLGGTSDMPDSVLHRQLLSLFNLFTFYHKSFEAVFEECRYRCNKFEDIMEMMCKKYLSASQHFGNTQTLTFQALPSLYLPKSAGIIFLRASQILQSCIDVEGVISGCIVTKNEVLYTLLPPSILRLLWFIPAHKPELLATSVKTVFPLPDCTFLVYVYLSEDQMSDIDTVPTEMEKNETNTSNSFDKIDKMNKFVLYMQGNSETQLMVLMKEESSKDPIKITKLWKIGLSSLVDLEMDIKNCLENTLKKDFADNYLLMQYDQMWANMKGHTIPARPEKINDQLFNRSTQLIHEILDQDSSIKSFSLRHADSLIYTHSLGSLQTYCQYNLSKMHLSDKLECAAEIVNSVEGATKCNLERDHGIILL
uniref:CCZ1/INTU/HSP4 first Longin domain-containing protein n=1 Tax=Strigamia maritima TaxID=126957 RepID=T1J2N8_STRMM